MKKNVMFAFIIIMFLVGGYFVGKGLNLFSLVTPPSTVYESGGKVYWLTTLSVDSAAETLTSNYRVGENVNNYQLSTGAQVQPKTNFDLTFSIDQNSCKYTLTAYNPNTFMFNSPAYIQSIEPIRQIEYNVAWSKNTQQLTLNAFDTNSYKLTDSDGKGEVVIKSLGSLQGMASCPTATNIIFCTTSSGQKVYLNKNYVESHPISFYPKCEDYYNSGDNGYKINFVQNFKSVQSSSAYFIGTMQDNALGTAVVTATADQDVFDSVIYTAPVIAKPRVYSITLDSLCKAKTATMSVSISNQNSNTGLITVTPSSPICSFSPQTIQKTLTTTTQANFIVNVPTTTATSTEICVEACGQGNQFETGTCSEICETKNIRDCTPTENACGNTVCEPTKGETYTTCPVDCPHVTDCSNIPNSYYSTTTNNCECKDGFALEYKDGKYSCNQMGYVPFLSIIFLVLSLGMVTYGLVKNKKELWIIGLGITIFSLGWMIVGLLGWI